MHTSEWWFARRAFQRFAYATREGWGARIAWYPLSGEVQAGVYRYRAVMRTLAGMASLGIHIAHIEASVVIAGTEQLRPAGCVASNGDTVGATTGAVTQRWLRRRSVAIPSESSG